MNIKRRIEKENSIIPYFIIKIDSTYTTLSGGEVKGETVSVNLQLISMRS